VSFDQRRTGQELREWERQQPDPRWRRAGEGREINRWGESTEEYLERMMWGYTAGEWVGSDRQREWRRANQGQR
jgi:hypothetical protein